MEKGQQDHQPDDFANGLLKDDERLDKCKSKMCTWQSLHQLRQIFFAFKIEHLSRLAFARLINPQKKRKETRAGGAKVTQCFKITQKVSCFYNTYLQVLSCI